jgi:hypothetical protein
MYNSTNQFMKCNFVFIYLYYLFFILILLLLFKKWQKKMTMNFPNYKIFKNKLNPSQDKKNKYQLIHPSILITLNQISDMLKIKN